MSRDAEAEALLRKRIAAMLACVGESESSLMDVIVGDRDSGIGYVNFRYDTDYFAAVKTSHTRRAHLAYGGFTAAQGYSPQDASDQLVEKLRRGARGAASESRSDAKCASEVAAAFDRMASLGVEAPAASPDYSRSVLSACEAINGHYSGSGEPMSDEEIAATVAFLRGRVAAWMPTARHFGQECYDAAVLALVQAALGLHDWATS